MKLLLIPVLLLGTIVLAQTPEPGNTQKPAPVPVGVPVSTDTQLRLLKAQHTVDAANTKMASLQSQWAGIQSQQQALQEQAKLVTTAITDAQKAMDAEEDAAYKADHQDKSKVTLNRETMTYVSKTASPAPTPTPAPTPEKK